MKEPMAKPTQSTSEVSLTAPARTQDVRPEAASEAQAIRGDDFDRNVWCLLGLPVDLTDVDGATATIDQSVRDNRKLSFVTPNVNWLIRSIQDADARKEILNADLSLVDGAPLVALAKMLAVPIKSRVAGSDLFETLRRRPGFASGKIKIFFFGGRDGAAESAMKGINLEKGGLQAVGFHNPGFGDLDSMSAQPVIDEINTAKPDFVVVALGAAKGQAWIERNQDRLNAPVLAHLGAVVDFTGGGISRAPALMRRIGLEWAWRIKEEPALWRRYFADSFSLAGIVVTKLLPQLTIPSTATSSARASARLERGATMATIRLAGDIRQSTLHPIREVFRQAAMLECDICLDFTSVASFDRSFLGMVLMLEKHVIRSGKSIYVAGVQRAHLRVLNANKMGYPIVEAEAMRPGRLAATRSAAV